MSCLIIGDKCWEGNRGGSGPFSLPTTGPHVVPREADPDLRGSQVRPPFSNRYWVFFTPSVDRYRPTSSRCNRNSTASPDLTILAGPPLHLCRTRTLPGTHFGDDPSAGRPVGSPDPIPVTETTPASGEADSSLALPSRYGPSPARPSWPALRPKSWAVPSWGSGTGRQLLLPQLARLGPCHLRPASRALDSTRDVAVFLLIPGASDSDTWLRDLV